MAWLVAPGAGIREQHVLPVADLVDHDASEHCVCRPSTEIVVEPGIVGTVDGPDGWIFVHHSLDGRELHEQNGDAPVEEAQQPAGPILDELGVTFELADDDRVTDVVVLAKTTNLGTGAVALVVASNDLDWIAQAGLLAAAQQVALANPLERDDSS